MPPSSIGSLVPSMYSKQKSCSMYDWKQFGGINHSCPMRVARRNSKIKNIREAILLPVHSCTEALKFELSGAFTGLLMLADKHVKRGVIITDGKSAAKCKTKSDQNYLVPIAATPSLLTTVPLRAVAKSVITNTGQLNTEYKRLDRLKSLYSFIVDEANYRNEANVLTIWRRWYFFWWFLRLHTGLCICDDSTDIMLWRYVLHSLCLQVTGCLLGVSADGTLGDRSDLKVVEKSAGSRQRTPGPDSAKTHRQHDK